MNWNDILAIPKRNNRARAYSTVVVLVLSPCPIISVKGGEEFYSSFVTQFSYNWEPERGCLKSLSLVQTCKEICVVAGERSWEVMSDEIVELEKEQYNLKIDMVKGTVKTL